MMACSPAPAATLSTPTSQPIQLYPEQRHHRTNSSPTSPLRKAISLSFFRGDRKRESAPVGSTSTDVVAAAGAPVARRRARRSMSMTRKRSKGSILSDGLLLPEAVDEETSYSSDHVMSNSPSSSSCATAAATFPQSRGVKTFSRRIQRRLSLVMSTAPDWSDLALSSAASGTLSAPPSRRPSTAASTTPSTLSASPLLRKASLQQGSFLASMPASWTNTIHSSSPSSETGIRPRSRLTRKVSEESFRCRGLESDDDMQATLPAFFPTYAQAGVHVRQNDATMLGQLENKENVYQDEEMDQDFGITTPRARVLSPAALRMNDFTLSAFNDAPMPSALSLRRRISPKGNVSPPLAPLNFNLNALQSGIPSRPVERPGSLYYISPAPSSIASFSASGHDEEEDEEDDSLSIADSQSSHPTSAWSAVCPPTPPSAIRLQLRFFGALPGMEEASLNLSTGEQLPPPVPAIFVQSGASTLELKEMVVEQLESRGVRLTPRDLILSCSTPTTEEGSTTASALGLAFSSSPPTASSPRSPTLSTLLGRELVNDRLLYEQGLLEDDIISVRLRPAYAPTFF